MAAEKKKLRLNRRAKWRPPDPPLKVQVEYYRALVSYTRQVAAIFEAEVFPAVPELAPAPGATDAKKTKLDAAFARFLKRASKLSKDRVNKAVVKMVGDAEVFQRKVFISNVKKAVGIDIEAVVSSKQVAVEIDAAIKSNYDLIASIKDSYSTRGRKIVEEGLRLGRAQKDIAKSLLDLGGFKDKYNGTEIRRAKTIARDQTQKFAKSVDTARQKKLGIKHFIWINSADSRVRETHARWGGHRFSYDDPPDGELPGKAVKCRCHARPDTRELLDSLERGTLV
jgi:SPP1 gp7 family putative phage head morphogenesis protein